jgi:PAS domain S-box-containing protein
MGAGASETGGPPAVPAEALPFRAVAEQLATLCWISDPEGQIVWVNDAWVAYTGADVEAVKARGLRPLHDQNVYGDVVRKWLSVKAAGEPAEMVFPLLGKDGVLRPFHTRVTPIRDREGRTTHWFGVNTDVSVQSETEARLRASDEQLREVFERAGDGIFITDATGRIIAVNHAACAMGQFTAEELLAMSVWDLIEQGEHGALLDARGRDDSTRDWKIRRKDGSLLDVEVSSRRLSDGRRLGVARDVSVRKLAEQMEKQALNELVSTQTARATDAERQLRNFWDASEDLFAVVSNTDGIPRLINERAWKDVLGYSADEITTTRLLDFIHPEDRQRTLEMRQSQLAERAYFGFENRYRHANGEFVWLSWNVVREGDLIFCSARDITERREAQLEVQRANARLAQAQKMEALGQLTGGVAHDFNNLLMIMAGQAELLRGRIGDDPRAARSLDAIVAAAQRGQNLTRHLLTFSRRQRLNPAAVSLASRVTEIRGLLGSSLGSSVKVTVDCPDDLWTVEVDVNEWELAVLNMAVNARDAMPMGGQLSIAARNVVLPVASLDLELEGEFIELNVSDTGIGIPADILPRVLDPFFTTKEADKGTGLGLSQVYGFVQQSGGRMTVQSELGQGTTIAIYLPRAMAQPTRPVDSPSPLATRSLDILCVEDNPQVADVAVGLLEQMGHSVRMVNSAAAAARMLEDGVRPDLVFSDIVMAGEMDGLTLARRIRQEWPEVPVLLATGYSREAEAIGAEFPILTKPYQSRELSNALSLAFTQAR